MKNPYFATLSDDIDVQLPEIVHNLCKGRALPNVVTDLIADHIDHRDLLTINTLSRELHHQANAIIYRHIILDFARETDLETKAPLLLRTLLTSTTAAESIRNLHFTGNPLDAWRHSVPAVEDFERRLREQDPPEVLVSVRHFTRRELDIHRTLTGSVPRSDLQVTLSALCLDILRQSPGLHNLRVSSDYFRFPKFREGLKDASRAGHLQSLLSCTLCLDLVEGTGRYFEAVRYWDDTLLMPFLAPNIDSIEIVMALGPQPIAQLNATSITRLVLYHCQLHDANLSPLLAATKRLRSLEYHAIVDWEWFDSSRWFRPGERGNMGLEHLYDALHLVKETLEELIAFESLEGESPRFYPCFLSGHEPSFRERYEILKLKHLHTLSIPYVAIPGWQCRKNHNWQWDKILPYSLHQITLTDDLYQSLYMDPWTEEDLTAIISSLLDYLRSKHYPNVVPKFALRLFHSDENFTAPVRQKISALCSHYSIDCSIEKRQKYRNRIPHVRASRPRGGRSARGRGANTVRGT